RIYFRPCSVSFPISTWSATTDSRITIHQRCSSMVMLLTPRQFKYLYAYSPYQKVKAGEKYPAVLFTTGDQDTRVPPLQARKMTARLQAASTSRRPILLLYDTKAGHA